MLLLFIRESRGSRITMTENSRLGRSRISVFSQREFYPFAYDDAMAKTPHRASGNPAKNNGAMNAQSQKQQRQDERQAKLAEYQRNIARRKRNRALTWVISGVAVLAVAGLVVGSYVMTPKPVTYEIANGSLTIEGVETFDHETLHTEDPVEYEQTPPAGGPHSYRWLTCAVYDEPVADVNAVHSMEHGAVWVTYDPAQVTAEDIQTLKSMTPDTYAILSPYEGMETPITMSAWNAQLALDSVDDKRITEFFKNYWRSNQVPEPGALCVEPQGGWPA